ncbi:limonene-1,2-epoxide hydrolase family protein [Mycolicibacterium vaccae]|jgi:limonene-1,2-epoxide hydrolase|uniref:Limonene-1,2-epoxide hydrolase n=1 Tax=Mycolicibacterium vaccae ATCC 25954 TaxID=1194972 RepID=K0US69_MYCVA|nr:limonene-1,2-epoxide hydrolase family protein [Mycolicibacterium vaccae]ANI41480.1 limonene-1,2-epoxide hydrolase [Mycolicibacterium vaccae 95051]EJZ07845.1 limonene-1,2-epoxide hydrolase [Mycolicibacterium vaccae ATCC 25954]
MEHFPDDLVTEFCAKWATPDPEELSAYFAEDGVYHNIPMEPAVGREAIKAFIADFTGMVDGIDFQVHRQVSSGALVFNERTDVMRFKDGRELSLPVAGVFEIVDGRIASWRDYFDMATVTAAWT